MRPEKKSSLVQCPMLPWVYNSNRTEWSPIQSVIIQAINKIGQPLSGSPICQSQVWLQIELDDKKSCYQLIITIATSKNNKYI